MDGLAAQPVRSVGHENPTAVATPFFTLIASVRELADGRVLVVDEGEQRLAVWNPATNVVRPIGGKGQGPNEFVQLGRLWAMPDDSTYMYDQALARWTVLYGDRIVRSQPLSDGVAGSPGSSAPKGIDTRKGVLSIRLTGIKDSMAVVYSGRLGGRSDTLGRIAPLSERYMPKPPPGPGAQRAFNVEIVDSDDAILFSDGSVAIARANPFAVQWCSYRGCGRTIVLQRPVALTKDDRLAYLDHLRATTARVVPASADATKGWPSARPGFVEPSNLRDGSALIALPDGRLLVHRFLPNRDDLQFYDLVDRSGRVADRLSVRPNQSIVGFGTHSIYISLMDDSGLQRLQRYPWP